MANFIYIPFVNPVKFFAASALPGNFHTKHFDDFVFPERLYNWQAQEDYTQVWQKTDTIYLQFESNFDPISITLNDLYGLEVFAATAILKLPNRNIPGMFAYEVSIPLADVQKGCYRLNITAGSGASEQKYFSHLMHITDRVDNSLLIQYWHTRYHEDVIFETGIKFQVRIHGNIGLMQPGRKEERGRDERYNPITLSAKTFRKFPVMFGDIYGLPDDMIDLLNRIWSCNHVSIDGKLFSVSDGNDFEFIESATYPKRGVKLLVEEGINRLSKLLIQSSTGEDPGNPGGGNSGGTTINNKKLNYAVFVDPAVFGDTANTGNLSTIPVIDLE